MAKIFGFPRCPSFPHFPGSQPAQVLLFPFPISHFPALAAMLPPHPVLVTRPPRPDLCAASQASEACLGPGYEMRADPTAGSWAIREAPTLTQG